ncbi:4'-phosphopantetheinyl transferase superfamily protein [Acidithiobacillus ferriphilus]|nr:4'-phosphopantetheinyl transferase superfamily protein [Acidithiobacillus ferriphilus]
MQSLREFKRKTALKRSLSIFTRQELNFCECRGSAAASLAGIFCAKEAFIKAISSVHSTPAFMFTDIEVQHEPDGRPYLAMRSAISVYMSDRSLAVDLSITHTADIAGAMVIVSKQGNVQWTNHTG